MAINEIAAGLCGASCCCHDVIPVLQPGGGPIPHNNREPMLNVAREKVKRSLEEVVVLFES